MCSDGKLLCASVCCVRHVFKKASYLRAQFIPFKFVESTRFHHFVYCARCFFRFLFLSIFKPYFSVVPFGSAPAKIAFVPSKSNGFCRLALTFCVSEKCGKKEANDNVDNNNNSQKDCIQKWENMSCQCSASCQSTEQYRMHRMQKHQHY